MPSVNATVPRTFSESVADLGLEPLPKLEADWEAAKKKIDAAGEEIRRIRGVNADLQSKIADLNAVIAATRKHAFDLVAGGDLDEAQKHFVQAETKDVQKRRLTSALGYVTSWSLENAVMDQMRAEIAERELCAEVLTARAIDQRKRMTEASRAAAAIDPGVKLNVKDAESQKLLATAEEVTREVASRRQQLKDKATLVDAERDLVAPALFNADGVRIAI